MRFFSIHFLALQLYAVAVKDLVRKTDKIYKVKSRNSTVEYTIKKLEPGGKYHVIVQLGNMSKESSMKINTGKGHTSHTWRCRNVPLAPLPQPKPNFGSLPGEVMTPQNKMKISSVFLLINGDGEGTSLAVCTSSNTIAALPLKNPSQLPHHSILSSFPSRELC